MKIEVIYESIPYTAENGMAIFHHRERELCSTILEVEQHSDIYAALNETGRANHILSSRVINVDETTDELATKKEIAGIIQRLIKFKGLEGMFKDIEKNQSKGYEGPLNIVIKSWGDKK